MTTSKRLAGGQNAERVCAELQAEMARVLTVSISCSARLPRHREISLCHMAVIPNHSATGAFPVMFLGKFHSAHCVMLSRQNTSTHEKMAQVVIDDMYILNTQVGISHVKEVSVDYCRALKLRIENRYSCWPQEWVHKNDL